MNYYQQLYQLFIRLVKLPRLITPPLSNMQSLVPIKYLLDEFSAVQLILQNSLFTNLYPRAVFFSCQAQDFSGVT